MDTWPEWKEKLIRFAKLESANRPALRKLLNDLDRSQEFSHADGELFTHFISDIINFVMQMHSLKHVSSTLHLSLRN